MRLIIYKTTKIGINYEETSNDSITSSNFTINGIFQQTAQTSSLKCNNYVKTNM